MDNECIQVAVGLCLGSALCLPHRCSLCGEQVNTLDLHGPSAYKPSQYSALMYGQPFSSYHSYIWSTTVCHDNSVFSPGKCYEILGATNEEEYMVHVSPSQHTLNISTGG